MSIDFETCASEFDWDQLGLDMSFWRKIVNDYREGFHGVISQPKSPKIANFGNPSGNGSK